MIDINSNTDFSMTTWMELISSGKFDHYSVKMLLVN